jgi:hypothetical protein
MKHLQNANTIKINDTIVIHKEDGRITQPPIICKNYQSALKRIKQLGGNDGWNSGWFISTTFQLARAKWAI